MFRLGIQSMAYSEVDPVQCNRSRLQGSGILNHENVPKRR